MHHILEVFPVIANTTVSVTTEYMSQCTVGDQMFFQCIAKSPGVHVSDGAPSRFPVA